jgi:hypothetical protein
MWLSNLLFKYFKGRYFVCCVLVNNVQLPLGQPLQRSIVMVLVDIVVFVFFASIFQSVALYIDACSRTVAIVAAFAVAFLAACVLSIIATQRCNYKPMVEMSNEQHSQKTCLNKARGTILFICIH